MNIFKKFLKKKGVSPVIAVVLMIAVAVAIAVIVYAWASGFTSEKTGAESAEAEQLVLESQNFSGILQSVFLRNTTSTAATLDAIYVDGDLQAQDLGSEIGGDAVTEVDMSSYNIASGQEVTIVTEEGTQVKFKVKG